MVIETVLSMVTKVCHFKKVFHRTWDQFKAAGMEIEDPGTVTFTEGVQATGIVKATPSGRAEVST
ncbi:MAG: hypothetical protein P8077_07375, partial [Gammaproteobacteria bacterium]